MSVPGTALVTGGSGFVGRHLVTHLREEGDSVVVADEKSCDVTDAAAVSALFERHRPAVVYHLAAVTHVGESWDAPARAMRVNAEGTLNVLTSAARFQTERVLVVGSAEEYGLVEAEHLPLSEEAPLRPTTPYGASKVAASFLALQAYLGGGLNTIRVRPFNHSGPGQEPRFLLPALAARVARAERCGDDAITLGSLEPVRDISDVRDVVRAYRLLVGRGEAGEVYNVCRGEGHSVRELAELFLQRAERPLRIETDPELLRPVDTPRLVGDRTKLTAATGWVPEVPLERTCDDLLEEARRAAARN